MAPGGPNDSILAHCNVNTAKYVAFLLGFILVLSHGVRYYLEEHDNCNVLLEDGYHLTYSDWQPRGCMMHKYTNREAQYCMKDKHIMLLGDSRVRQLFFEGARTLSDRQVKEAKYHENLSHQDASGIKLDFIWLPEVNKSANAYYEQLLKIQRLPDILIHGSASWAIKQNSGSPEALEQFKVNLSSLLPIMDKVAEKTNLFWMTQQPVESLKLNEARQVITNEQIEEYNMAVQEILAPSNVKVWKSAAKVSAINDSTEDGLHVKPDLVHTDVQLIINWYCNKQFRPFDGELYCCQPSEEMTPIQQLVFLLFLLSFIYGLNAKVKQWWRNFREYMRPVTPSSPVIKTPAATSSTTAVHNGPLGDVENGSTQPVKVEPAPPPQPSTPSRGEDYSEIAWALGKFGLIMLYFYICDRSGFIPREQKHFTRFRFYLPLCYVTLLGFFFNAKTSQTVILNRDQTDEWKGWMQLVILIYHMSGASAELPIYMHIRILVAMYLFQTGYGHFSFFWSKGDYGFVRFIQVQFRLNWLVFMLCLVMNRPYQFYYFVPLVTFWFILVYVTMAIWPQVSAKSVTENSSHYVWMVFKFVGLIGIIVTLSLSEVFFYNVFDWWPLKTLCVTTDGRLYEWWFRWQLDRFIVPVGMIFAFLYLTVKKYKPVGDEENVDICSGIGFHLLLFLGFCLVSVYTAFALLCPTKPDCNQTHSYISPLPVIGFILLRNVPGRLRTRYSTFFAWFGKISLELFIGQYHIWLAADTKGILILIPGYPAVNLLVTSFIFVCCAHEIFVLTVLLQRFFVPKDLKLLLKRMSVFVIIIIAVLAYQTFQQQTMLLA